MPLALPYSITSSPIYWSAAWLKACNPHTVRSAACGGAGNAAAISAASSNFFIGQSPRLLFLLDAAARQPLHAIALCRQVDRQHWGDGDHGYRHHRAPYEPV